ncbi:MAG: hypothetical protein J7K22_00930 [Nanoarchaeota archaeon]|nr:hypothetical protein [Nanoarchaeota archaeon]
MKEAYFALIAIPKGKDVEKELELAKKAIGVEPMLEEHLYAVAATGGLSTDALPISPQERVGGDGTVYSCFMFPLGESGKGLEDIMQELKDKLGEKKELLKGVYRIVATDVPEGYKIIRKLPCGIIDLWS